jgi:hypothetical protein
VQLLAALAPIATWARATAEAEAAHGEPIGRPPEIDA